MKNKKLPQFYKVYFSAIAVFAVLLIIFSFIFYGYLKEYNKGIHETVSEKFYTDLFVNKDVDKIISLSGITNSEFETVEDLKSFIKEPLSKTLSYTYISSADNSELTRQYIVKSDEYKIATFTLSPDENGDYKQTSLSLHLPKSFEKTYNILDSSELYINGVKADSKYIQSTYNHEVSQYLPDGVKAPQWTSYKITGLTKEPVVTVVDRNQNKPVLLENNGIFFEQILEDKKEDELIEQLLTASKEYAKCMQYDAPKNKVLPYFEKGTDLYNSIRTVENMFVWDHNGYAFEDESVSEFRRYDENTNQTYPMRSKEDAIDYRYFTDPNLPPVKISNEWVEEIKNEIPRLQYERSNLYINDYGISRKDAYTIVREMEISDYYEECIKLGGDPVLVCNWLTGSLIGNMNKMSMTIKDISMTPQMLVELIKLINDGKISGKQGKEVLEKSLETGKTPSVLVNEMGLSQITDETEIRNIVKDVINENLNLVDDYKAGKRVFDYFIGQIMKKTRGRANPVITSRILKEELDK